MFYFGLIHNSIGLEKDKFQRIEFNKSFFENEKLLDDFVSSCDVIVHLAGMNRHGDAQVIYNTNISLAQELVNSLKRTRKKPHIIFSSSSQEERDNLYGKSSIRVIILFLSGVISNTLSLMCLISLKILSCVNKSCLVDEDTETVVSSVVFS